MMDYEPAYSRLVLAQLAQRNVALLVDFIACAFLGQLIEALLGLSNSGLGLVIFGVAWMLNRVFIAGKSQGQSLGRWLVSIRVVDMTYGKSAGVLELFKREAAIYLCMALVLAGFNSGGITNTISFFALIPIVIDGVIALADSEKMQTLHDKLSGTIVIVSKRGLQLDQKITKLLGQASRGASKAYQSRRSSDNRGYGGYSQGYGQRYAQDYDNEFDDDYDDRGRGRDRQDYRQDFDDDYDVDPYQQPRSRNNPQSAPQGRTKRNSNQDFPPDSSRSRRQSQQDDYDDDFAAERGTERDRDRYSGSYQSKAMKMTIMVLVRICPMRHRSAPCLLAKRKNRADHVFSPS
jgi:uncharacterized RDD family membrane protein YckC